MMIWQYRYPTNGPTRLAFGVPVDVFVLGRQIRAVYQFQGGDNDQVCAVVHHASGRIMARVYDHHTGYPQQRAQAALDEKTAGKDPATVWKVIDAAMVLNPVGSVVGVLR